MNDGTAHKGGSGLRRLRNPNSRPRRCRSCGSWISPRCVLCVGQPDPAVSVEFLARCRTAVDHATHPEASLDDR
jgi:hypothetical protein